MILRLIMMFILFYAYATLFVALSLFGSCENLQEDNSIMQIVLESISTAPAKDQFKAFHYLFGKPYDLNSEIGLQKYRIFKANLKFIRESNDKNLGYTLGVNQFSDLTSEEFRKAYLNYELEEDLKALMKDDSLNFELLLDEEEIYTSIAFTSWESFLPAVRSQGACGSCWAFGSEGSVETNYKIKTGKNINLSRQDLVDCSINGGCGGGSIFPTLDYIKNGIAKEIDYPYTSGTTGAAGVCKKSVNRTKIYKSFHYGSGRVGFQSLMLQGSFINVMDGSAPEIQSYKSGIIDPTCKVINHIVYSFEMGTVNGTDYYKVRNSWGDSWGMNGNFMIKLNSTSNTCFLEIIQVQPIVFDESAPEPVPENKCLVLTNDCYEGGDFYETCNTTTNVPLASTNVTSLYLNSLKGTNITFFQKPECRGDGLVITLNTDFPCLSFNIKSFYIPVDNTKPPTGCIWVYESSCLGGKKTEICSNNLNLSASGIVIGSFIFSNSISYVVLNYAVGLGPTYRLSDTYYQKVTSIILVSKTS